MSMERVTIPGTDLAVSPLCLGGNRLGGELDRDRSFALLDAFVEAGGNFVDTAHVYADWLPDAERSCSERTIGRWRAAGGAGGDIVIATKIGHPPLAAPGRTRLDRGSLRQDVFEALDNLGLSRLDLVYLHRDEPARPAEEILGVLEELRREGRIAHYGASNWTAARLGEADEAARRHGWEGFRANQAEWSLASRNPASVAADLYRMDADMIRWHGTSRIAAVPYSTQARGYFDKQAAGALDAPTAASYDNPQNRRRAQQLGMLAESAGLTPTEAMLALFRLVPFAVIPVVGCRDASQVASSFRGIGADLPGTAAREVLGMLVAGQPA
ncbi:MAG TPA: aldo/keto reductase [Geminicoccaceae bacterium]|nr:aldo/keto reductase [Geminicoccus sp.]HMU49020.1 aldo/keto reductase [Geminicoccaceae bacterium]